MYPYGWFSRIPSQIMPNFVIVCIMLFSLKLLHRVCVGQLNYVWDWPIQCIYLTWLMRWSLWMYAYGTSCTCMGHLAAYGTKTHIGSDLQPCDFDTPAVKLISLYGENSTFCKLIFMLSSTPGYQYIL